MSQKTPITVVARRLGITPSAIYQWISRGKIAKSKDSDGKVCVDFEQARTLHAAPRARKGKQTEEAYDREVEATIAAVAKKYPAGVVAPILVPVCDLDVRFKDIQTRAVKRLEKRYVRILRQESEWAETHDDPALALALLKASLSRPRVLVEVRE